MMMLRTADGGAVVHALDVGPARKPLPRWVWMAVAASAALHAAGGIWLYQRKFEAPPVVVSEDPVPPFVIDITPPPPKPVEATPPKPPTPVHKPKAPPTELTRTLPIDPPETPPATYSTGPELVAKSPVSDPASVEVKPVVAPPPPPPVIANPKWISKPTPDQMARWYPLDALEKEVSGRVVMTCRVTATGTVGNCAVTSEEPAGYGFGEAAVKLSRYFRMSPRTVDGQPVEGAQVAIPLRFGFR